MAAVGTAVQYRESATAAWWAATVIFIPPDAGTTRRLAVTAPDGTRVTATCEQEGSASAPGEAWRYIPSAS